MRAFIKFLAAVCLLLPNLVLAKGDGVGFTMEGTVTNVSVSGESIHFAFTGVFHITQFRGLQKSIIDIDCKQVSTTVTQNDFFVATHPSLNAAAVRNDPKVLANILKAAAERSQMTKFELVNPKIIFSDKGNITSLECAVVRATDWDLR